MEPGTNKTASKACPNKASHAKQSSKQARTKQEPTSHENKEDENKQNQEDNKLCLFWFNRLAVTTCRRCKTSWDFGFPHKCFSGMSIISTHIRHEQGPRHWHIYRLKIFSAEHRRVPSFLWTKLGLPTMSSSVACPHINMEATAQKGFDDFTPQKNCRFSIAILNNQRINDIKSYQIPMKIHLITIKSNESPMKSLIPRPHPEHPIKTTDFGSDFGSTWTP